MFFDVRKFLRKFYIVVVKFTVVVVIVVFYSIRSVSTEYMNSLV